MHDALPALGELARRVTMQEIEIRRDEAASHAESHEGSSDYAYHCQERDFWFNVSALVALATGGPAMREARDAWREYAEHAAGCVECGETSWENCFDGKTLREAALAADALTPERPADAD